MLGENTNKLVWVAIAVGVVATLGIGTFALYPDAFSVTKSAIVKEIDNFTVTNSNNSTNSNVENVNLIVKSGDGSFPTIDYSELQSIESDYDSGKKSIDGVQLGGRSGIVNISNIKSDDSVWLNEINSELSSAYLQDTEYHVYNATTQKFEDETVGYSDGVTNQLWQMSVNSVLNQDSSHKFKDVSFDLTLYYTIGSYDNGKELPADRTDNEYYYPITVHVTVSA